MSTEGCERLNKKGEGGADRSMVEQLPTEFFSTYVAAQKSARALRRNGWRISVGMGRREDGKDFYVRAWRRTAHKSGDSSGQGVTY